MCFQTRSNITAAEVKTDINGVRKIKSRKYLPFKVGDIVMKRKPKLDKTKPAPKSWTGPYKITAIHSNGVVTLDDGKITKKSRVNMLKPYREQTTAW